MSAELEALLIMANAIDLPERPPPGRRRLNDTDSDSEDDFSDDDRSSRMFSAVKSINAKSPKNIRSRKADDDDEEFEFDL
jgi:hypothetical protein